MARQWRRVAPERRQQGDEQRHREEQLLDAEQAGGAQPLAVELATVGLGLEVLALSAWSSAVTENWGRAWQLMA